MSVDTHKPLNKNDRWGSRVSDLKVQVDRWPLTADKPTGYVLTIICVAMYAGEPSKAEIIKALGDAILIVKGE